MCRDIMALVSGLDPTPTPARLFGFSRWCVRGETYPGIRPDPAAVLEGLLYPGLDEQAWARLDAFEGPLYERLAVELLVPGELRMMAETYAIRPEHLDHLSDQAWSYAAFLEHGKQAFIAGYRGFEAISGRPRR
jgi:gamma-glutamylcyclotransferase (GGCT)/AIG2-like uncharacterized protein YtfP